LQPLGGKKSKRRGQKKRSKNRTSQTRGGRGSGIVLSLFTSWQGRSQKPGRERPRVHSARVLPRSWRVAAVGFMAVAGLYGLSAGGHIGRSADYATKKISTIIVSAGFAVNKVTIEGQFRSKNSDVMKALGLDRSTSTLAFDTAVAQDKLEKLPMVRRARVMRLLPSQLHVVLEERVPYAVWQNNSALHLVDQDGVVIGNINQRTHRKLPLVVGVGAAKHARDLLSKLSQWPRIKTKVQAAVRVADRRWNLKLHNGMEVRLPENDAARALKKVAELERSHAILSGDAISLDLRLSDRVTIRLSDDAASRRDSAFVSPGRKRHKPGQDT